MYRTTPPSQSTHPKPVDPDSGVSLSSDHVAEAQKKSTDSGASLDISLKKISEVNEEIVHKFATLGQPNTEGGASIPVSRYYRLDSISCPGLKHCIG